MMLTPKQETFATGLASGLTKAASYRVAYPNSVKWTENALNVQASRLAADPKISLRVAEMQQKAAAANEVTVERIVKELAKIAFGNSRRVMSWGPGGVVLKDSEELDDADAVFVSEVTETTTKDGGSLKLKTHDKVGALRVLAEYKGMFTKKMELTGKDGRPLLPATLLAELPKDPAELAALYAQFANG